MIKLSPQQQEASSLQNHICVLASAGTGKTTVLTQRFINLLSHASHDSILAFTFTEKATHEMKERILDKWPEDIKKPTNLVHVSTIHSFCSRLIDQYGYLMNVKTPLTNLPETSYHPWLSTLIKEHLTHQIKDDENFALTVRQKMSFTDCIEIIRSFIIDFDKSYDQHVQNIHQIKFESNDFNEKDLSQLYELALRIYEIAKGNRYSKGLLTFSDLEHATLEILNEHPSVQNEIQSKYRHILVDEYQDTNPIQYQIIRKIFNPEKHLLFIVGDPKQSIFAFRNADPRLFFETQNLIETLGGKTIYLNLTHRTPPQIVETLNNAMPCFFSASEYQEASTTKPYDPQESVTLISNYVAGNKNLEPLKENLAEDMVVRIHNMIESGINPQDIVILYDRVSSFKPYAHMLEKAGITFAKKESLLIKDIPAIRTRMELLRALANSELASPLILHHALKNQSNQKINSLQFKPIHDNLVHSHQEAFSHYNNLRPSQILEESFFDNSHRDGELNFTTEDELTAYELLHSILIGWESLGFTRCSDIKFLLNEIFDNSPVTTRESIQNHCIQAMTIHSSKGLEFDHVFFIIGGNKKSDKEIFIKQNPHHYVFAPLTSSLLEMKFTSQNNPKEKENQSPYQIALKNYQDQFIHEFKRLIYVAMTRPKKALYFYHQMPSSHLSALHDFHEKSQSLLVFDSIYKMASYLCSLLESQKNIKFLAPYLTLSPSQVNSAGAESTLSEFSFQSHLLKNDNMRPFSISVTALQNFITCPKRFHLRHQLGLTPQRSSHASNLKYDDLDASTKGSLTHLFLQFYKPDTKSNLEDLVRQTLSNFEVTDPNNSFLNDCQEIIAYFNRQSLLNDLIFNSEESYAEYGFAFSLDQVLLMGQIDKLIWRHGGNNEIYIIDYKSHHYNSSAQRDLLIDKFMFQLKAYALAIRQSHPSAKISALIIFTRMKDYVQIQFSDNDLDCFEKQLLKNTHDVKNAIMKNNFEFTNDKKNCEGCHFFANSICGITSQ